MSQNSNRPLCAKDVLDAVERWVGRGTFFLREVGGLVNGGRIDALLVPASAFSPQMQKQTDKDYWDRAGLVGVEVKVSRSDFLNGLKSGQFERYAAELMGLYIATPAGLCKPSEVPKNMGLLIVCQPDVGPPMVYCRRHPAYCGQKPDIDMLWRVIFRLNQIMREKLDDLRRELWRKKETQ